MTGNRAALREATNAKIAKATLEVALANGPEAVTVEEVARRSGVAKTTIYRRYRNSAELLDSIRGFTPAIIRHGEPLAPTKANLRLMIEEAVRFFDQSVGVKGVGSLLSSDSTLLRVMAARVLGPVKTRAIRFFANGARQGVFREGIDVDFILDVIIGAMVVRAAMAGVLIYSEPDAATDGGMDGVRGVAGNTAASRAGINTVDAGAAGAGVAESSAVDVSVAADDTSVAVTDTSAAGAGAAGASAVDASVEDVSARGAGAAVAGAGVAGSSAVDASVEDASVAVTDVSVDDMSAHDASAASASDAENMNDVEGVGDADETDDEESGDTDADMVGVGPDWPGRMADFLWPHVAVLA